MPLKTVLTRAALALAFGFVAASIGHPAVAKDHSKANKPPVDDSKLTCKQLSGRIQVLILQARTYDPHKQQSGVSRTLQGGFSTVFGNNARGVDPDGAHAGDLKTLQGYNQRLVELGCKSYDLDAELKKQDPNETPSATIPAPKKTKPAAATPAPP